MTPEAAERQQTLASAVARFNELQLRDSLALSPDETGDDTGHLTQGEVLELLALGEIISRKAAYGRQLAVRTARMRGASWAQIGAALGTARQSAWEAHSRWIDEQAAEHGRTGYTGFDTRQAASARELAGPADAGAP
jgi:hypothetical protein